MNLCPSTKSPPRDYLLHHLPRSTYVHLNKATPILLLSSNAAESDSPFPAIALTFCNYRTIVLLFAIKLAAVDLRYVYFNRCSLLFRSDTIVHFHKAND
jgi:hypothetical protein